jgi:hypothetical protein
MSDKSKDPIRAVVQQKQKESAEFLTEVYRRSEAGKKEAQKDVSCNDKR